MLVTAYEDLVRVAPRRHKRGKCYLHGRTGVTSSGASSNRREEHLAVALLQRLSRWHTRLRAAGHQRPLEIIDYQMPLKARQVRDRTSARSTSSPSWTVGCLASRRADPGGHGTVFSRRPAIAGAIGGSGLLRHRRGQRRRHRVGGRHSAAPAVGVSAEAGRHGAGCDYWAGYLDHPKAGRWLSAVRDSRLGPSGTLGLEAYLLALLDARFELGLSGQPARLIRHTAGWYLWTS